MISTHELLLSLLHHDAGCRRLLTAAAAAVAAAAAAAVDVDVDVDDRAFPSSCRIWCWVSRVGTVAAAVVTVLVVVVHLLLVLVLVLVLVLLPQLLSPTN